MSGTATNRKRRIEPRRNLPRPNAALSSTLTIGAALGLAACRGAEPPVAPSPPSASASVTAAPISDAWRAAGGNLPRGSVALPTRGHLAGVRCAVHAHPLTDEKG